MKISADAISGARVTAAMPDSPEVVAGACELQLIASAVGGPAASDSNALQPIGDQRLSINPSDKTSR